MQNTELIYKDKTFRDDGARIHVSILKCDSFKLLMYFTEFKSLNRDAIDDSKTFWIDMFFRNSSDTEKRFSDRWNNVLMIEIIDSEYLYVYQTRTNNVDNLIHRYTKEWGIQSYVNLVDHTTDKHIKVVSKNTEFNLPKNPSYYNPSNRLGSLHGISHNTKWHFLNFLNENINGNTIIKDR